MMIQCEHGGGDCTLSVYNARGRWLQFQSPRAHKCRERKGDANIERAAREGEGERRGWDPVKVSFLGSTH